jgi:hypothetical protein
VPASQPLAAVPGSLLHTFPRFQCHATDVFFILVPAEDCHFVCAAEHIEKGLSGLPYPKLQHFIQSLVDANDEVGLCDAVDGTNVDMEWAMHHLDLVGTNDVAWAERKNKAIEAHATSNLAMGVGLARRAKYDILREAVDGKRHRIGPKRSPDVFMTRFRLVGSPDPWEVPRDFA